MRHLSAIILILLLTVAPSCKFLRNIGIFGKKNRDLEMLHARQDSLRVADSIRKVQEALSAIEKARLDSISLAEEAMKAAMQTGRYNIIVGSFITPEYAKSLSENYRHQGYDAKIFKMEGSKFELVSAESYESIGKAISRLHQFQDTVELDAWMYIRQ